MKKERKDKNFIKKPSYPGGLKVLQQFINQNLRYPVEALLHKIEGTVFVRYSIDHEGRVIDTKAITSLGYGCDEEAQRVVRLLRFNVPKNRGVRAIFHKDIYVHFRLPKPQPQPEATPLEYEYTAVPSKTPKATPAKAYTITIEW